MRDGSVSVTGNDMPDIFVLARQGNADAVRELLLSTDGGAAGATDPYKWSALHYAASEGRTDVAMLLLGAGAPVDCRNIDGWTPLHFAARAGHGKVAALLLEAGANKNTKSGDRRIASEIAWAKNKYKVSDMISAYVVSSAGGRVVAAATTRVAQAADDESVVAALRAVYAEHVPGKSPEEVDAILAKFIGREESLLAKVLAKYTGTAKPARPDRDQVGERAAAKRAGPSSSDSTGLTMESELGKQLAACSTSSAWFTLEAVAGKVSKRAGRKVSPRELDALMVSVGEVELRSHGVWRTSFGKQYMPIVVVNTAFARTVREMADPTSPAVCSCGAAPKVKAKVEADVNRYFGSQDYNAGRHASTASAHKGQCLMWRPPTTGHLHSWRRGFTD
jgi:hypothetical protein